MLSRLRDFVTRHRRKFIVSGVIVGGTYFAFRYAQRRLIDFQERQARDFIEKQRRMQHFESTERTCNQVIVGMSGELCTAIIRECSTDALLAELRQQPANKLELWQEMKIVAFTRLATLIYGTAMLVVALRIQMNLLGGYLYRDITGVQDAKADQRTPRISDELKQQYLSLIRHFVHDDGGLPALVRMIRSKVLALLQPLELQRHLTLSDVEQLFWSLQMSVNSDAAGDPCSHMARYLLPAELNDVGGVGCPQLQRMHAETLDLLESDDACAVVTNNICRGFSLAVDAIAESLHETVLLTPPPNTRLPGGGVDTGFNNGNDKSLLNINSVQMALARLIPIVSGLTSRGFDSTQRPQNLATSLVTFYVVAEKCKMLGANVYETFSTTAA